MDGYDWAGSTAGVDWDELATTYRIAPLGTPAAAELKTIYGNWRSASFAYTGGELVAAAGHKKIILYASPGKEGCYASRGFLPMNTAMAIWRDPDAAVASGPLRAAQL